MHIFTLVPFHKILIIFVQSALLLYKLCYSTLLCAALAHNIKLHIAITETAIITGGRWDWGHEWESLLLFVRAGREKHLTIYWGEKFLRRNFYPVLSLLRFPQLSVLGKGENGRGPLSLPSLVRHTLETSVVLFLLSKFYPTSYPTICQIWLSIFRRTWSSDQTFRVQFFIRLSYFFTFLNTVVTAVSSWVAKYK